MEDFSNKYHKSVLLKEVLGLLKKLDLKNGWFLDGTLGDGGYAVEVFRLGGKVFGVDVDPKALERSKKRFEDLKISEDRFILEQGNFRDINNFEQTENLKFKAAILDLGVSSLQLASPERGFSFTKIGPLDMRMDPTLQVRALDLINGLNKGELYELFNKLGEEKFSRAIADLVDSTRRLKKIESTKELADLVLRAYGRRGRAEKTHPATRIFQALRIAVNDELNALKEALPEIKENVEKNGYIIVISFHSLEDRIVKDTFRQWESDGLGEILNKKPIVANDDELFENPRSRSAKMRVFVRS